MRSTDFGWLVPVGLVGRIICIRVVGEESCAASCSGCVFGEFEDGCLDLTTKPRRAAMRSASDCRVTLLVSDVLGITACGVARLLGFWPPIRLAILPVSSGAGSAGALDLDNPRVESKSDRGDPMRCAMLSRLGELDWILRPLDGALIEGDERSVEIDPPVLGKSLGR